VNKLTIVTPSEWLQKEVSQSFFSKYPCYVINNGIDLNDKDYSNLLLSVLKEMEKCMCICLTEASNEFLYNKY
jgi:hypothetical protein